MDRTFSACKQEVYNRGVAPDAFLNELIDWAVGAPSEIFERNNRIDIYSRIVTELGPWESFIHRKAAMLEALRVLGGFESSWDWEAGRDTTNPDSNTPSTEEAGIFQCSANSMNFDDSLSDLLLKAAGKTDSETFITTTKSNHPFAIEYCARLIRFTVNHHGPIKYKHINPWLRRDAMLEFMEFLERESKSDESRWPHQDEVDSFYGNPRGPDGEPNAEWERDNIVKVKPPWQIVTAWDFQPVSGIRIHRECAESLKKILEQIWISSGHGENKIKEWGMHLYAGAYKYRLMRGGTRLSMHSWGCAVDFDSARNAFGDHSPNFGSIPPVLDAFANEGWTWGGDWRTPDGMHWQAANV